MKEHIYFRGIQAMKYLLFTLIIAMSSLRVNAQTSETITDTTKSVYKHLPVKQFYRVNTGVFTVDGNPVYKVNDSIVSKAVYDKYHQTWNNMVTCTPCVLISYDVNGNKIRKAVQYTDCIVGYYIEYYPNGKVKAIKHYKENDTGDWKNLSDRGYCKKDGIWTYFDEQGKLIKTEIWKDNVLVK